MVLRPHGQALRLSAAHSQQPGMGKADKLSPRLCHGLGPELTLLVSHGGHFEQVGALLHLLGSAGQFSRALVKIGTFEALLKGLWRVPGS